MSGIVITSYSEDWPELFRQVREELLTVFAPVNVSIEHVGSTSVPGLAAKPVIDALLGAGSLADIESRIEPLSRLGYTYVSKYEQSLPMRRYFVKAPATSPRIHLHAVEHGSRFWQDHVTFRDLLREDPGLRSRYQSLKLHLACQHAHDKSAYTAAKAPFIQAALATATGTGNAA